MFIEEAENLTDPEWSGISEATIQFILEGCEDRIFFYLVSQGKVESCPGIYDDPDVTITTTTETWVRLILGEISPLGTYIHGQVEIKGDIVLAQRAIKLFRNARVWFIRNKHTFSS